jgi:hypothetical protein
MMRRWVWRWRESVRAFGEPFWVYWRRREDFRVICLRWLSRLDEAIWQLEIVELGPFVPGCGERALRQLLLEYYHIYSVYTFSSLQHISTSVQNHGMTFSYTHTNAPTVLSHALPPPSAQASPHLSLIVPYTKLTIPQSQDQIALFVGALVAGGGITGYVRTGSIPSVVAGCSVGLLVGLPLFLLL